MNNLKIFENAEFGKIRTVVIDGVPWFVGKDVAEALGYAEPRSAVSKKVEVQDRGVAKMETPSGIQEMTTVNESGLYDLIFGSKLESAKRFKHWVTHEVLPAIRKTGAYAPRGKELIALALIEAQKTIEESKAQIERMKPKEIFADAVSASHTSILIGDLAKLIRQNGIDIGQKRLFDWLRENGYLIKRNGADRNMPTQKSMELSLFEIKERTISNPDGSVRITRTTMVTGRGQVYFVNKLLERTTVA